ncbi:MAG: CotH kinase family protein [Bacteroidales bacterium]
MKKILAFLILMGTTVGVHGQLVINEIFVCNTSTNMDTKFYNYSGWVEVYNVGTADVSPVNFYFSDDVANIAKWKLYGSPIKSKQFAYYWFDANSSTNHTSFKLNSKGGSLFLYRSNGTLSDSVAYPKQFPHISYSRYPDGAPDWKYSPVPTQNTSNSEQRFSGFTSNPVFSQAGGIYYLPFSLELITNNGNAEIKYTIDGSEPTLQSKRFLDPITISATTIIRARVFEQGKLPSDIFTQSYLFPSHKLSLPVYSIVTNSNNLWDNTIGIHVSGTNGTPGYCSNEPRNYNQDWERPVNIEFFDSLGIQRVNQYAGIKIAGNCSRGFEQKSFTLIPRGIYGKGKLNYKFFNDKAINGFDRIFLRNSGNDWSSAFMRDALFNELVKGKMDIDYNAYQPSVVYLNGVYWGLMDTREKIEEHYITTNYKLEENEFDLIENYNTVFAGSYSNYSDFLSNVLSLDFSKPGSYEYLNSQMDINEYINYMITEIYIGNTDWPGNNLKFWKSYKPGSKWRWILTDLDFGFGVYDPNIRHNTLQFALEPNGPGWPNPPWSTELFRKLVTCEEFKQEFIRRFANYLNTFFAPQRVIGVIDSIQNKLKEEIIYHNQKWNAIWDWDGKVQFLRDYATLRPGYVFEHLQMVFGLKDTYKLTLKSNIQGATDFYLDGISTNGDYFNGKYFQSQNVNITPVARKGYKFLQWQKKSYSSDSLNFINKSDTWLYSDNGNLPAENWFASDYNDDTWKSGNAQLGYGDGDETTLINYGPDAANKYISYYFRKKIVVNNSENISRLKIRLLADDGAVVYINNNELVRLFMPQGAVNYYTLATSGVVETTYYEYEIPASVLVNGENTIAVEVHQVAGNSSDISFDLELTASVMTDTTTEILSQQMLDFTSIRDVELTAIFEETGDLPPLFINEVLTDNQQGETDESGERAAWIELYNSGNFELDLAGLYISNDKENPVLWQIPFGQPDFTKIPAKGFKAFWADGQTTKGILHLPFSLNKSDGWVYIHNLTLTDTLLIDSVHYPAELPDVAYGRYKDGFQAKYTLASPTFSAPNKSPNILPVITSVPITLAHVDNPYIYKITSVDANMDILELNGVNYPSWLQFIDNSDGTGTLTGTPSLSEKGYHPVSISVNDGKTSPGILQLFNILVQGPLGVEETGFSKWKIYPNPVKDQLTIKPQPGIVKYSISLFNLYGSLVYEKKDLSGNFELDLFSQPNGTYFLVSRVKQNSFITKLIKTD